eukprot:TRINITY_DN34589_c0_g1_i1.p1 TRINITY_DN34589_c0_g1~~TRINITY_DN34589_c0_g1_i1.p1  ORF type:complete len:581 (+),score=64.42 TRINITY_DN34589_c0_g1_i1:58-1800(+)
MPPEKKRKSGTPSDVIEKLRAAKKMRKAWVEQAVVVEQAARGVDLLFFSQYTKMNESGKVTSDYLKMVEIAVGRLLEGWSLRHQILHINKAREEGVTCSFCMSSSWSENCLSCTSPVVYHRVIWVAALYMHKLVMASILNTKNLDYYLIAALLLSLKVQMPTAVPWGVGLTIQLITGAPPYSEDSREFYASTREEVLKAEQKVLQIVGERNIRCLLPMDHIDEGVKILFGEPLGSNEAITDKMVVREHRRKIVWQRAARFCGYQFYTPLLGTCDPKEIAFGMVWVAWRTSCSTAEEVEFCEESILKNLGLDSSIEDMLVPSPRSIVSLLQCGILTHGDRLWFGDVHYPQATLLSTAGAPRFQTESKIHDSLLGLTMSFPRSVSDPYSNFTEEDLLDEWKVRRGENLYSIATMHEGWPRKKRKQILQGLLGPVTTSPLTYEVLYWMVHYWVQHEDWAPLKALCVDSLSPGTRCLRSVLKSLLAAKVLLPGHNVHLGGFLSSLSHPSSVRSLSQPWKIYEAPDASTTLLDTVPPRSVLPCSATFGNWYEVTLPSGEQGWGFANGSLGAHACQRNPSKTPKRP